MRAYLEYVLVRQDTTNSVWIENTFRVHRIKYILFIQWVYRVVKSCLFIKFWKFAARNSQLFFFINVQYLVNVETHITAIVIRKCPT